MQAMLRALRVTAAGAPDATFLRARISRAAATGRLLLRRRRREPSDGAGVGGGGGGGDGGGDVGGDVLVPAAIAVLRGDALVTAHDPNPGPDPDPNPYTNPHPHPHPNPDPNPNQVTAHYRLGIGVNAAFRTLQGWQARSHRVAPS